MLFDREKRIGGYYNVARLPDLIDYMGKNRIWATFFEKAGLPINDSTVARLMTLLVRGFRRPLIVTGCRVQCAFCNHDPSPYINPAPWDNYTSVRCAK